MYYSLITGSGSSKILVRTLVKYAWGVEIEPDIEWYDAIRATIDAGGGIEGPKVESVECVICRDVFERIQGTLRDTCSEECRSEKRRRTNAAKQVSESQSERLEYTQTGCPEFKSWNCPEMLPLEWVNLPVAVKFNAKCTKQNIEVAA